MSWLVAIALLILTVILMKALQFVYRMVFHWRWTSCLRQLPTIEEPPRNYLVGHAPSLIDRSLVTIIGRWWKQIDRPPLMRSFTVGMKEEVYIFHPRYARALLQAPITHAKKGSPFLLRFLGKGLVTLDEPQVWSHHRKLLVQAFDTTYLRSLLEDDCVPGLTEKVCEAWSTLPSGTPIAMHNHLSSITLDTIGRAGFGHDFGFTSELISWSQTVKQQQQQQKAEDQDIRFHQLPPRQTSTHPVASAFSKDKFRLVLPTIPEILFGPIYTYIASHCCSWTVPYKRKAMIDQLNRGVTNIISEHRSRCEAANAKIILEQKQKNQQQQQSSTGKKRIQRFIPRSILELLVSEQADLSNEELRDEAKTFVLAGAETTSTAVNHVIFALCTLPNGASIQQKLYEDIIKHWPKEEEDGISMKKRVTIDAVNQMTYLDAVLRETLRLYPPIPVMGRVTSEPIRLDPIASTTTNNKDKDDNKNNNNSNKDLIIPSGTRMRLFLFHLHRHPQLWGERAEEFYPERWHSSSSSSSPNDKSSSSSSSVNSSQRLLPIEDSSSAAFMPFSNGIRYCIGKIFALMEAKLILATLIQNFEFSLAQEQKHINFRWTSAIVLSPDPQFLAEVTPRQKRTKQD